MKKIIKILIFLILIGIVLNITLSRYVAQKSDISRIIGNIWTGGQISTHNYAAIIRNFEYYLSLIEKEEYEKAYKYTPYEYKTFKSYENFVDDIKKIDYKEFNVTNIIRRTENMYSILLNSDNGEKLENLIIFNEDNTSFTITPENFIEYKEFGEKIKKKKVEYCLISTENYIDKFVAKINITNLNKKDSININGIELVQNNVKHIKRKHKEIRNNA